MGKNALATLTLKQTLLANPGKEDIPSSWRCVNSLTPDDPLMLSDVGHHWFRQWLVTYQVTSHCLNQWWFPGQVNAKFSTFVELIQLKVFIQENVYFNCHLPLAAMFCQPWVNSYLCYISILKHAPYVPKQNPSLLLQVNIIYANVLKAIITKAFASTVWIWITKCKQMHSVKG